MSDKFDIRLPSEAIQALNELAERKPIRGAGETKPTDHLREALRIYFEMNNVDAPVEVNTRGRRQQQRASA